LPEDNLTPVGTAAARRRTGLGCLIVILLLLGLAWFAASNLRKTDPGGGPDVEVGVPGQTLREPVPTGRPARI